MVPHKGMYGAYTGMFWIRCWSSVNNRIGSVIIIDETEEE